MAVIWKYMQVAPLRGERREFAWEAGESLDGLGNSPWFLVPKGVTWLIFTITSSTVGQWEGKVQTSTDTVNTVKEGNAEGLDWPDGSVHKTTRNVSLAPSAFRLVVASGNVKMTVRAV